MSRPIFGFLLVAPLVFAPALVHAEDMAPAALNSFSATPAGVSSAQLLDQNRNVLGTVERVQTDQDGKPSALSFKTASNGRTVVVSASEVSFDGKVLITSSDQPQIAELIGKPVRTAAK